VPDRRGRRDLDGHHAAPWRIGCEALACERRTHLGEDGAVLGMDEGPDKTPALLVCPPHPARVYVSARIAKHDEVLNGGLSSILCVASGVYAVINVSPAAPLWLHLVYLPLSPALGALGGYLRSRQNALRG